MGKACRRLLRRDLWCAGVHREGSAQVAIIWRNLRKSVLSAVDGQDSKLPGLRLHPVFSSADDSKARLSSIAPSVVLGSLLDDQHWHSVLLERVGKQANFTVDTNTQHFRTKGETDVLDIDYEVSQSSLLVPRSRLSVKRTFKFLHLG